MLILALIVSLILLTLAAVHMLWGFGYWFPIRDEATLVRAVVGTRDVERMPGPIPCGIIAALLLILIMTLLGGTGLTRSLILGAAVIVFAVRGVLPLTRFWRRLTIQEPFATYDKTYYGPGSLVLSALIAILLIAG